MDYSAGGLHITALGTSVVFVGLVLLAVAAGVIYLFLNRRKGARRRPEEPVAFPLPAAEVSQAPAPAAGVIDSEAVAAVAACLACMMDGRVAGEVEDAALSASLVAAMTAAIVAREEAGETLWPGPIGIRVRKGVLG